MSGELADSWQILPAGTFALDGGSMFGLIPRALWEPLMSVDGRHRVRLGLNTLLIHAGNRRILVDTGIGRVLDDTFRLRYAPSRDDGLGDALASADVPVSTVTDVINTHLHWDHAGGNTVIGPDGRRVPAFSSARYFVQRGEWLFANSAVPRTRGSYRPDDYEALADSGQLVLLDGATTIAPGVAVHPAPGHLPHMQVVTVRTASGTALFAADLIPTSHHLGPAWGMSFDCEPLLVSEEKNRWLNRAAEANWSIIFYHDPDRPVGRVLAQGGRMTLQPVGETERGSNTGS